MIASRQVALSWIIPAYNEARRLPPELARVRRWLDAGYPKRYQVVVVDDGSTDGLDDYLRQAATQWPELTSIRHERNQGKGAAVRTGLLHAQGALLLFADADGATPVEETAKLCAAIDQGADVAIGSRWGPDSKRPWGRGLGGRLFSVVVRKLFRLPVADTQCGFKMFRFEVGRRLALLCHESGYLIDIELLALAHRLGHRISEVQVAWREIPGSKVHLIADGWKMLVGLVRLRRSLARWRNQHDR